MNQTQKIAMSLLILAALFGGYKYYALKKSLVVEPLNMPICIQQFEQGGPFMITVPQTPQECAGGTLRAIDTVEVMYDI